MNGRYFVSYSRTDGVDFAGRLADRLVAGRPSYAVWLDVCDVQPGVDWDEQITAAIQTCRGLLFIMTKDSVQDRSGCKDEWVWALRYKKPVIPLRMDAAAGLPFRLSSREYIDFSASFRSGMARLRAYLGSVGSPKWVLQELRDQLTEAERELPRADPAQRPRIEQDIEDLGKRIADQVRLVDDPEAAAQRTEERINAGLDQERHPARSAAAPARARFVNKPPVVAPGYFQDRHVESELIGDFLRADDERIMTVVGRGGVGKTVMVCRLLKALEGGQLPDDLGELDVCGIVYLSPAGLHPVNFPNLFTDLCRLLPPEAADRLLQRYRDPQQTPAALMRALLDAMPSGRVIVLLDQVEDDIDTSTEDFAITDAALDEALRALLAAPPHGVKVIVTTRVAPRALLLVQPQRQRRLDLDEGLGSPYAEEVLRARDPDGRLGLKTAPDELLDQARRRTRGYPRALEALAAILAADRDTTLLELLTQTAQLPENVVEVLVGQAFNRLDSTAQQMMQALAVLTAPVPRVAVDYLLQPYRPAVDAVPVLGRLVNMQFVRRDAGRYYLHQVDRDYALSRIPAGDAADRDADPAPFTQQALRHRGAKYFERTRTPRDSWRSLDDIAAQLAEFELRCANADYETAAAVLHDIDFDYLQRWGHYRLAAEMYQRLQGHLNDSDWQMATAGALGSIYLMLGQTGRAIECTQQALTIARETSNRNNEGLMLASLGNSYQVMGQMGQAIERYQQALTIARETSNRNNEGLWLGNLGDSYRVLGQTDRAIKHYQQALTIARETGNRNNEGTWLGNLGSCYQVLGQTDRASEHYQQALAIARETGSRIGEGKWLGSLGDGYQVLGQRQQAIEYTQQALAIAREIGDRNSEGRWLGNLGDSYRVLGQTDQAIEYYQQALTIARETGNRIGEGRWLGSLGSCYRVLGQTNQAIEHYQQALAIACETGNRRNERLLLDSLRDLTPGRK